MAQFCRGIIDIKVLKLKINNSDFYDFKVINEEFYSITIALLLLVQA